MPELPEIEAWVRELDGPVSATPVLRAGPAHIATLKTFDPPLASLEGGRLAGARRRGKHLLFPTEDGELVLRIHLMSAGRLRHLRAGAKGPKSPAFRLAFEDGSELVLTEAGPKKRAGVWLETPATTEAELAHLGPDALGGRRRSAARDPHGGQPQAASAPARPARARRDRARARERDPVARGPVAVRALDPARRRAGRTARRRDPRGPRTGARAPSARARATRTSTSSTDGSASPARTGTTPRAAARSSGSTTRSTPSSTAPPARRAGGLEGSPALAPPPLGTCPGTVIRTRPGTMVCYGRARRR